MKRRMKTTLTWRLCRHEKESGAERPLKKMGKRKLSYALWVHLVDQKCLVFLKEKMCVLIFEKWFQYMSLIISWGSSKLVGFFPPCINSSYGLQGWYIMVDVAKATAVELGCTIFVFAVSWLNNIFTIKIHEIKSARMLILCRILIYFISY